MKSLKTLIYNGIKHISAFCTQQPLASVRFSCKFFKLRFLHTEVTTVQISDA